MGYEGVIAHYDGSKWFGYPEHKIPFHFDAVWGSSASDVYAVGSGGKILHSTGLNNWSLSPSGTIAHLYGVWGSSASNVFAVGYQGVILHKSAP